MADQKNRPGFATKDPGAAKLQPNQSREVIAAKRHKNAQKYLSFFATLADIALLGTRLFVANQILISSRFARFLRFSIAENAGKESIQLPEFGSMLDQSLVVATIAIMQTVPISKAKAGLSGIARNIIKKRQTVIVRTPSGYIQMAPYDPPESVPEAPRGSIRFLPGELETLNRFGESL